MRTAKALERVHRCAGSPEHSLAHLSFSFIIIKVANGLGILVCFDILNGCKEFHDAKTEKCNEYCKNKIYFCRSKSASTQKLSYTFR